MRPRRDPVPRAKEAWWWLGGLLTLGLLGGGVVVAGIALWENIDIRQLTPSLAEALPAMPVPELPTPAAIAPMSFDAVLLSTNANRDYFEDGSYYRTEIARWRGLVEGVGGTVRVATDAAGLRDTRPDEVMVLPEAPCLSSSELAAIGAHVAAGGNLVTNWALGVRDGSCEWRGWTTLLDVTGGEDVREVSGRDGTYITIPGGLPASPGLDPGTRIELRPDPSLSLRMSGERVYWSDWALNPAPDEDGAGADVAVSTSRTEVGGRVAWFGLRSRQAATPTDSIKLDRLLRNGILWAAGTPTAVPDTWPGGARAALVFTLDVEGGDTYVNARDAAAVFELEEVPITFFAVSQLVRDDRELAGALIAAGEVGSQTVDHTPLAGLTGQEQGMRLRRSWADIEEWTGIGPAGLRPPEEAFDSLTLNAWRAAGGSYLLTSNEARSASPEVHQTSSGPLVLLPRLIKDDYAVIVRDVTLRSQRLAEAFLAGVTKMRAIGGLAVVSGHTQIIVSGPRLDAFRTVADSVRSQGGWWLATAGEVADWWLERSEIEIAWVENDPTSLRPGLRGVGLPDVEVSAPSGSGSSDLWVDISAPRLDSDVIPLVDGVSVDFAPSEWGMRVRVGPLEAGAARRISFAVMDPGDTDE
jgi:peptidoglycan/xylan/chitin deacetylase (PgdA/CDA1 family)